MFKLYFYPFVNAENDVDGFQAKLISDEDTDYLYDITYTSDSQSPQRYSAQLLSHDTKELNYIKFDHFNEGPYYEATFWEKLKMGTGPAHRCKLKLKPKVFFKQRKVDSYTQQTYYSLSFELIDKKKSTNFGESLKNYTKSNLHVAEPKKADKCLKSIGILDKANFLTSIDLHIEMLVGDPGKMNKFEKLQYQVFKANEYLEEAYMLGIEKVYLLHGVGKGRLKDELAKMLKSSSMVREFKNEYHGQFGFGATEVTFK